MAMASKTHSTFDAHDIKLAAAGRWEEILINVGGIDLRHLHNRHSEGPCPKCSPDDPASTRFRFIDPEQGALYCSHCFSHDNGDGIAAIRWLLDCSFPEALNLIGEHLGIAPNPFKQQRPSRSIASPGAGAASTSTAERQKPEKISDPTKTLTFHPEHDAEYRQQFADSKGGDITTEALLQAGAVAATHTWYRQKFEVLAFPIYGERLAAAPPIGYVLTRPDGNLIPCGKKGSQTQERYKNATGGDGRGVLLSRPFVTPEEFRTAGANAIWKTEGVSDFCALLSKIETANATNANAAAGQTVITNPTGASGKPPSWLGNLVRGLSVNIVHDIDEAGQAGAMWKEPAQSNQKLRPGWAPLLAASPATVRNIVLPLPQDLSEGKDLRDWFAADPANNSLDQLQQLADASAIVSPAKEGESKYPKNWHITFDPRDHTEFARIAIDNYERSGKALRTWKGTYWKFKGRKWESRDKANISDRITKVVEQVTADYRDACMESGIEPTEARPGKRFIGDVIGSINSRIYLPDGITLDSWLTESEDGEVTSEPRQMIAFKNGILDIDKFQEFKAPANFRDLSSSQLLALLRKSKCFIEHTPQWFSQVVLPYDFDPRATCPKWLQFITDAMEGDIERMKLLQEWIGYNLIFSTDHQAFLCLYGVGGNGKSTFFAGMRAAIGDDNVSSLSVDELADKYKPQQTLGKRTNIAPENVQLTKEAIQILKMFSSGDSMIFEEKYRPAFKATPTARITLSLNERPRIADKSDAFWRRAIIVPFFKKIASGERVFGMDKPEWWMKQGEAPGIFLWAFSGLLRLKKQGAFTQPAACEKIESEWRLGSDPVYAFVKERLQFSEKSYIPTTDLYETFQDYCKEMGNIHIPQQQKLVDRIESEFPGAEKKRRRIFSDENPRTLIENISWIENFEPVFQKLDFLCCTCAG